MQITKLQFQWLISIQILGMNEQIEQKYPQTNQQKHNFSKVQIKSMIHLNSQI